MPTVVSRGTVPVSFNKSKQSDDVFDAVVNVVDRNVHAGVVLYELPKQFKSIETQ